MAIKLAFSTVACPDWSLEQVVEKAKEMGYDGVELRTLGPGSATLASDPALSEPAKVAAIFERGGVQPVVVSTSVALHHDRPGPAEQAKMELGQSLELAAAIGCPFVRVFGHEVRPGQEPAAVSQRIASAIKPFAESAGALGVQILFENAGSYNRAKQWWSLFNLVDHPMVGLCWNVANAAAAGEPAVVSVPTLNSRIKLAKVKDTKLGEGDGFVPLGEGDVGIELFLKRLLGIGFDGYVSVEWDRLWLANLMPAEEYLPEAQQRLRQWLDTIAEAEEQGRKAAEKAAKKNAPNPAVVFASKS